MLLAISIHILYRLRSRRIWASSGAPGRTAGNIAGGYHPYTWRSYIPWAAFIVYRRYTWQPYIPWALHFIIYCLYTWWPHTHTYIYTMDRILLFIVCISWAPSFAIHCPWICDTRSLIHTITYSQCGAHSGSPNKCFIIKLILISVLNMTKNQILPSVERLVKIFKIYQHFVWLAEIPLAVGVWLQTFHTTKVIVLDSQSLPSD